MPRPAFSSHLVSLRPFARQKAPCGIGLGLITRAGNRAPASSPTPLDPLKFSRFACDICKTGEHARPVLLVAPP